MSANESSAADGVNQEEVPKNPPSLVIQSSEEQDVLFNPESTASTSAAPPLDKDTLTPSTSDTLNIEKLNLDTIRDAKGRRLRSNSTSISADFLCRLNSQDDRLKSLERLSAIINQRKSQAKRAVLERWMSTLDNLNKEFKTEHSYIQSHCPAALLKHEYFAQGKLNLMEMLSMEIETELSFLIQELPADLTTEVAQSKSSHHPRLPDLPLPTFDGSYANWPDFKTRFSSLVLNDVDMSPMEKIHYLRGSLKGEPLNLVTSFPLHEDHARTAWDALESRYENKRFLIMEHLNNLHKLSPVPAKNAEALNNLITAISTARNTLTTQVSREQLGDCLLTALTLRLLDRPTIEAWETSLGASQEFPAFEKLHEFLSARVKALERVADTPSSPSSTPTRSPGKSQGKPQSSKLRVHIGQTPSPVTTRSSIDHQYPCSYCAGVHYIVHCVRFRELSPKERREIVVSRGLCFNCLGKHSARNCQSKTKCKRCGQLHHTMIHPETPAQPRTDLKTITPGNTQ